MFVFHGWLCVIALRCVACCVLAWNAVAFAYTIQTCMPDSHPGRSLGIVRWSCSVCDIVVSSHQSQSAGFLRHAFNLAVCTWSWLFILFTPQVWVLTSLAERRRIRVIRLRSRKNLQPSPRLPLGLSGFTNLNHWICQVCSRRFSPPFYFKLMSRPQAAIWKIPMTVFWSFWSRFSTCSA